MSSKEVSLLRKSGKLMEAYKMAINDLNEDRSDPWAQTSLFWVMRDVCQELINRNEILRAKNCLREMSVFLPTMMDDNGVGKYSYDKLYKQLLPNSSAISQAVAISKQNASIAYDMMRQYIECPDQIDPIFHEELGWIIYRYLKEVSQTLPMRDVKYLLKYYLDLKNDCPSMLHSQMLNLALNLSKGHPDFSLYHFFLIWGPEKLREEDKLSIIYEGNEIASLISRVCREIVNSGANFDVGILCDKIKLPRETTLDLLREPQFWNIFNLYRNGNRDAMFEYFYIYNQKNAGYGASHWHSEVLRLAERYMQGQEAWRFIYFFRDWGYDNLRDEDWREQVDDKGNKYKFLAVRAAKKCFESLKDRATKDAGLVSWLDSYYNVLIQRSPKDLWTLRQWAIVCTWQNRFDQAICLYKSLLLEMSEKYYIWSELADCIQNDIELKLALLSKALLVERDEKYLGLIHLNLSEHLIAKGLYAEALCELNTYKKNHKNTHAMYQACFERIDASIVAATNNKELYQKYATIAEDYAFSEIEEMEVTLVGIRDIGGKSYCTMTDGREVIFQVNAKRFPLLKKAVLGTVFRVKCHVEVRVDKIDSGKRSLIKSSVPFRKYIPLCIKSAEVELWSGLPEKYGYVEYLNEAKKILHIVTQDSVQVFHKFSDKWGSISRGDFIRFRQYSVSNNDGTKVYVAMIEKMSEEVALPYFRKGIVAVDNVNNKKQLFHYTFGQGKMGGIVFFNTTELRPKTGQCLSITYYISKDKKGEKKCNVLHVEKTSEINPNAIKTIKGQLVLKYKDKLPDSTPDYAFIDDYYVHRSLLSEYKITEDCYVTADIVYSGRGKWRVVKIY